MTSTFGFTVDSLSSVGTYQDDAKVQQILYHFGAQVGLWRYDDGTLTNQQRLDMIRAHLVGYIQNNARLHWIAETTKEANENAPDAVMLE